MATADSLPARGAALIVGADRALRDLLALWLAPVGLAVVGPADEPPRGVAVALVDIAFLRESGADEVAHARARLPAVPLIVLSSAVFPGVDSFGPLARALQVDAIVPKPIERARLLAVIGRVLGRVA